MLIYMLTKKQNLIISNARQRNTTNDLRVVSTFGKNSFNAVNEIDSSFQHCKGVQKLQNKYIAKENTYAHYVDAQRAKLVFSKTTSRA